MLLKRFTPLFVFLTIASAFVAGQLLYKEVNMAADLSPGEQKSHAHYEAVFEEAKFKTTDGDEIVLADVEAPIVILNFWASWCTPCLVEFPSLVEMNDKFSDKEVLVLGINTDSSNQDLKIERVVDEYKLNFKNIADTDSEIVNQFIVRAIPVSIIFHNGKVIKVSRGQKDFVAVEFLQNIKSLLRG